MLARMDLCILRAFELVPPSLLSPRKMKTAVAHSQLVELRHKRHGSNMCLLLHLFNELEVIIKSYAGSINHFESASHYDTSRIVRIEV